MHRRQLQIPDVEEGQNQVELIDQKVRVFERDQEPEIDDDGNGNRNLGPVSSREHLNATAKPIVDRDDRDHDQNVGSFAPDVEKQARDQKNQVSVFRPGEAVEPEQNRQEKEQKER